MPQLEDFVACAEDAQPDRIIVLAGTTGTGKSTLADVLAGRYNGGLFPVSSGPASHTQGIVYHNVQVSYGGNAYVLKIVDTIGFADTRYSNEQVLRLQAELGNVCSEGIHQVLFVTQGRFTGAHQESLDSLLDVVFEPEVARFCTVVRTRTPTPELADDVVTAKTEAYKQDVIGVHSRVQEISTFLMVSNPDDGNPASIRMRKRSRRKLIEHIILHYRSRYVPPTFAAITARIDDKVRAAREQQEQVARLAEEAQAQAERNERQRRQQEADNERLRLANEELKKQIAAHPKPRKKPWYKRLW